MIKGHLGKALVIGNLIVLILLIYDTFTQSFPLNADILTVTQIGLTLISITVLFFVLRTYKTFKEKDLLVGLTGFLLIAIAYSAVAILGITKMGGSEIETSINVIIAIGYLLITLAAGWIK